MLARPAPISLTDALSAALPEQQTARADAMPGSPVHSRRRETPSFTELQQLQHPPSATDSRGYAAAAAAMCDAKAARHRVTMSSMRHAPASRDASSFGVPPAHLWAALGLGADARAPKSAQAGKAGPRLAPLSYHPAAELDGADAAPILSARPIPTSARQPSRQRTG